MNTPNKIIVHHTGGTDAAPLSDSSRYTVEQCDRDHKARWPGFTSQIYKNKAGQFYHVGYHFFIDKEGVVTQCRGVNEEGAHTIGQNNSSIGIVLAGNFDATLPTDAQLKSFRRLVNKLAKEYSLDLNRMYPHRKYANKTCYGRNLSDTFFVDYVLRDNKLEVELTTKLIEALSRLKSITLAKVTNKRYTTNEVNSINSRSTK